MTLLIAMGGVCIGSPQCGGEPSLRELIDNSRRFFNRCDAAGYTHSASDNALGSGASSGSGLGSGGGISIGGESGNSGGGAGAGRSGGVGSGGVEGGGGCSGGVPESGTGSARRAGFFIVLAPRICPLNAIPAARRRLGYSERSATWQRPMQERPRLPDTLQAYKIDGFFVLRIFIVFNTLKRGAACIRPRRHRRCAPCLVPVERVPVKHIVVKYIIVKYNGPRHRAGIVKMHQRSGPGQQHRQRKRQYARRYFYTHCHCPFITQRIPFHGRRFTATGPPRFSRTISYSLSSLCIPCSVIFFAHRAAMAAPEKRSP